MSKNYADALKKKPPPAPQARGPVPKSQEESRSKRPRDEPKVPPPPTPSTTTPSEQSRPLPARPMAWGRPDASAKKPPTILQRPKQGERAPVIKPPPQNKKSKKPRPSQLSLGDVIPKHVVKTQGKQKEIKKEKDVQSLKVSSQEDFPSLSAAGTSTASKPKPSLPAHAGWGKKAPLPKKEKPIKKLTSKQQKPAASTKKPETTRPSLLDFGAKQRTDESREEHDLIRLLKADGKVPSANQVSKKGGRQRIAPRKKKFTTLKKKVLQERLEAWRKLHPEEALTAASATTTVTTETAMPASNTSTCTVCLKNFAEADEVEDDDEYQEIVENVKEMAVKVGPIRDAFVHRLGSGPCPAFIWFETPNGAAAACACWNGLVVGGQTLEPVLLHPTLKDGAESDAWRDAATSTLSLEKDNTVESRSVILKNVLSLDDFEDKDHLEESLSNVRSLAEQHGPVSNIEAKQDKSGCVVIITYNGNDSVAKGAVTKLDGLLVSGNMISASLSPTETSSEEHAVELKNALTEDDLEDEDCLQESLNDIESLAKSLGPLSDTDGIKVDRYTVVITYKGDLSVAKNAAAKLDGTVLGGNILQATVSSQPEPDMSEDTNTGWILLQNILTEDDIADEDCMEESIEDVRELASQYGNVLSIDFDPKDLTRVVRVKYDGGNEVASFAASKFNNMVLGGQTIAATTMAQPSNTPNDTDSTLEADKSRKRPVDTAPKPLYSGDKLIPERFAEAKRVPKVVTSTGPREYASISKNEEVVPLLIEMLGELMRLQRRAIEDKNAKARRRIVMGLREVGTSGKMLCSVFKFYILIFSFSDCCIARGIRAHKVKMVVMANNVDQYGAIDDKLQEIIDLARQEDVPVIFELNKRKLGKAVGKSIKVSVVGIQNADGAHQQFKKLASLASKI